MPYLGLRGNKLPVAISLTAGMGWILFGLDDAILGAVTTTTASSRSSFHLTISIIVDLLPPISQQWMHQKTPSKKLSISTPLSYISLQKSEGPYTV
ncbi:hypothetical protein L486_03077 [Kwoniella mangroviensis CBS 10435]|uniref:Major facilitator superfamily (MFS) profile domain-containing protein n=1 Tax=Kwoniella mangroviensis CBS 10435 TaxID=1331196 RepID=A0A1B9ISW8_9TREE|nr:hypothetical protein L486_03077 [Kwoniella mangroviensis CBS 10435]